MCGRLLCCLGYEYETYRHLNRRLPNPGSEIFVGGKKHTVIGVDTLKELVKIRFDDRLVEISRDDLEYNNNKYSIKRELLEQLIHKDDESNDDDDRDDFIY